MNSQLDVSVSAMLQVSHVDLHYSFDGEGNSAWWPVVCLLVKLLRYIIVSTAQLLQLDCFPSIA